MCPNSHTMHSVSDNNVNSIWLLTRSPGENYLWYQIRIKHNGRMILTPGDVETAFSSLLVFPNSMESSESLPGLQALYLVNLYSSHQHRFDTSAWSALTAICPALVSSRTVAGTCVSMSPHLTFPDHSHISHCQGKQRSWDSGQQDEGWAMTRRTVELKWPRGAPTLRIISLSAHWRGRNWSW